MKISIGSRFCDGQSSVVVNVSGVGIFNSVKEDGFYVVELKNENLLILKKLIEEEIQNGQKETNL